MPTVYVGGKFEGTITLADTDYPYKQWIDKKLAKEREDYKKPKLSLWLEMENKEDPISPLVIPVTNLDVYEGAIKFSQNEMKFTIDFDGKAKVNVHKDVKTAIDAGEKGKATAIAINGAEQGFDTPIEINLTIQSKKL